MALHPQRERRIRSKESADLGESGLERLVRERLDALGIPNFKAGGGRRAPSGLPDRCGALPPHGRLFFIELKAPGEYFYNDETCRVHAFSGNPARCLRCGCTPLQLKNIARYKAAGAIAFSADSWKRIEEKLGLLQEMREHKEK